MSLHRYTLALCTIAVAITSFASTETRGQTPPTKVSFRLEWTVGGYHAPFFLAKERGYYTAEGLDVEFLPGAGSLKTVSLVGNKSDMIGLADAASLIIATVQGVPVKMAGTIANQSQFAVLARADRNIKSAKDLEGKKIAITPGSAHAALFPAVIASMKLNRDRITLVNVDAAGATAALLNGTVDAQVTGVEARPLLESKGLKIDVLRFADLGANTIGRGFVVHEDTLAAKPEWLSKFLKASLRGWAAAPEALREAALATQKNQDATARQDADVIQQALEANLPLVKSEATKALPVGHQAIEDWQTTLKLMKDFRDVKTDRDARSFFTNDFLPKS